MPIKFKNNYTPKMKKMLMKYVKDAFFLFGGTLTWQYGDVDFLLLGKGQVQIHMVIRPIEGVLT
jgi:hypothetical protein